MSSGPETTTTSASKSKTKGSTDVSSTTKTTEQMALDKATEALQDSQQQTGSLGQIATQNVGQTATQQAGQQQTVGSTAQQTAQAQQGTTSNVGQEATSQTGQQLSEQLGQTANVGQTQQLGQTANVGTSQQLGQQSTSGGSLTTGQTETQGLAAAQPLLQDIINQAQGTNVGLNAVESGALSGMVGQAQQNLAQFNPQIAQLANDQFAGGGLGAGVQGIDDQYNAANQALGGIAAGNNVDIANNPYLQQLLQTTQDRIRNDVGSQFAGAGRSFSGAHAGALGGGMMSALAPIALNQYNTERGAQTAALQQLQGAAQQRSAAMDSSANAALAARGQGAATAKGLYDPYNQALAAGGYEAQQPLERLGMLGQIGTNVSGTGGTSNTLGTTANQGVTTNQQTGLTTDSGLSSQLGQSQNLGTSSQLGMLNTANQGLTNTANQGTSSMLGQGVSNTLNNQMVNSAQQGLVNTQDQGLTNTAELGYNNTQQMGAENTNLDQSATGTSSMKGTTDSVSKGKTTGTSNSQVSNDPLQTGLGLLSGGLGLLSGGGLLSDRRAKEAIEQIGTAWNGLPIYRYRYRGDDTYRIGFMADEVEEVAPEAVTESNGFKTVNYKLATEGALR